MGKIIAGALVLAGVGAAAYALSRRGNRSGPTTTCDLLQVEPGASYEIHIYSLGKHSNKYIGEVTRNSMTTKVTGLPEDHYDAREKLVACVLGKGALAAYEVHDIVGNPGAHTLWIWTKGRGEVYAGVFASANDARAAAPAEIAKVT